MALLTEKITTLDDYLAAHLPPEVGGTILGNYASRSSKVLSLPRTLIRPTQVTPAGMSVTVSDSVPYSQWWVHREVMRQYLNVYPKPTKVITHLQNNALTAQYLVHVSAEDPDMIAYTASVDDGLRDRQTRMALGRFLRKYATLLTDEHLKTLESSHRVELNPPIRFIVAEKDPDEFLNAYMNAHSSCMSKGMSAYSSGTMHPVQAYCTPGFQLAVIEDGHGRMSGRSLVWINPEDPNDKRMVRHYAGDEVLGTYLENHGFKYKGFAPAYLKTAVIPGKDDAGRTAVVCPYVDAGAKCASNEKNGNAVWDGLDKIYLLSSAQIAAGGIPSKYLLSLTNSGGLSYALPFPINRTCAVSGEPINAIKQRFCDVWINGRVDIALTTAVSGWRSVRIDTKRVLYAHPDTPIFRHGAIDYLDTESNRNAMGYVRLDAKLYPNEQNWRPSEEAVLTNYSTASFAHPRTWIKVEDAVHVIRNRANEEMPLLMTVHHERLPTGAVRVHQHAERKCWAMPEVATVRTSANREVVPGVHDVKKCWDNQWRFTKQLQAVRVFGEYVWIPKDKTLAQIELTELPAVMAERVREVAQTTSILGNAKKKALFAVFARSGDMMCPRDETSGGGYSAAYLFEYRDIPLKLVEAWCAKPFSDVTDMPNDRAQSLHKFAPLVFKLVEETWTAHWKNTKAAAAVEPAALAA